MNEKILDKLEKKYLKFKLGEEQKEVLLQVFQCIDTKLPLVTSIVGPAGTGKSTIAKLIIEYLGFQKRDYLLASPTHKAKTVLSKYTGKSVITLHRLLNLSPIVDILDLNFNNLQFGFSNNEYEIPLDGVLIIDECSMVNKDLYKFITEKATNRNCMIIFIGDLQQLRPVKENKISESFTNSYPFELTKIYRQKGDNPILDLLDEVRNTPSYEFKEVNSENGSLVKYDHWRNFIQSNKHLFQTAIDTKNPDYVKLLAYTNVRVEAFNQAIRNEIFTDNHEYNVGDLLIGYDTIVNPANRDSTLIINSSEYRVNMAQSIIQNMAGCDFHGWNLELYSFEEHKSVTMFMLSRNNPIPKFQILAEFIENLRIRAINTNKSYRNTYSKNWKDYFSMINGFLTTVDLTINNRVIKKKSLDFGYCITVHRSQGSTFDNILIDMENILRCKNKEELQQLQYVALSRTRKDIHILI